MSSRQKAPVYISVYVVKPRRSTTNRRHHHHHHHHHHHRVHHRACGGYDRKAELLRYCQELRSTACHDKSSSGPKAIIKPPALKIIPSHRNPSVARHPTCLGDWKRMLLPGFVLRSVVRLRSREEKRMNVTKINDSIGNTMHAIAKSLRVEKRQGFIKKLISAFRSHK